MALEVGSVLARLGARLDESGFDRFDRRFHKTRTEAEKGVTAKASVDTRQAEAGFSRYTRKVDEADHAHGRLLRGSLRLHEGLGRLAVGGAGLAGVALGFEGLKEGVVGSYEAFEKHDKLVRQTEAVLRSTGGAAGVTAEKVDELVKARERLSGQDQDTIRNGANVLLTFRNIRDEAGKNNDVFDHALGLTQDLATAMHMDLQSAALQVGKALNDPEKGMTRLQRIGVTFTKQQIAQAKAMEESGNRAGAQRIILNELSKEFEGSSKAQATWTDKLKTTWHDLQIQLGQALAPAIERGEKWLARFLQQVRDNRGEGGKFREEVKKVAHELGVLAGDAKDVVTWLGRHKGLLKDLIGAYATYRGTVLLAAGATKTKGLATLFTGLGKRQAEVAGAEAGAAYGGALLPAITAYVVAKGSVAILRAVKKLAHFDNPDVTLDDVKATAPGSAAEAAKELTGYHAVTGVKASGRPAAPSGPAFPAIRSGDVDLVTKYADQIQRIGDTGRRRDVLKVATDLANAAGATADPHKAALLQAMENAVTHLAGTGNTAGIRSLARALETTGGSSPGIKRVVDGLLGIKNQAPHARKGADDVADSVHGLDKRSGNYRSTAAKLRSTQGSLNTALTNARNAGRRGAQGLDAIASSADDAVGAVQSAASSIAGDVNTLAKSLGLKGIHFTVAKTAAGQRRQSHTFGSLPGLGSDLGVPGHAVGGIPHPGSGSRDDHLLVGPDGIPVAAMSGTEGILNTPQMGIVDAALGVAKALGVQPYGGLGELWSSGLRHYDSGGLLARADALDRMHLPYVWGGHHGDRLITDPRPGLDCSSAVSYVLGIPPRVSGAFESYGAPGPGPVTIYANPEHVFMSILGRGFGTSAENPGGGAGWLSYSSRPGFVVRHVGADGVGGGVDVTAPTVNGPAGGLRSLITGAVGRMTSSANSYIGKALGALNSLSGQPLREGGLSKAQLAALWRRANGNEGDPNLMAAIALAESAGVASASNGPYHGLWQVGPGGPFDPLANARAAGEKLRTQGLGAWQTYTEGTYRQFLAGGGIPKAGKSRASRIKAAAALGRELWGAAKGFYPGASAMPPTSYGVMGYGHDRSILSEIPLTLGSGDGTGGQGHRHVYIPDFLTSPLDEAFASTLLHEWAHAFQAPSVFGAGDTIREGGAQAFTRNIYGRVMRAAGLDPTARKWRLNGPGFDSYYRFARDVTKTKGIGWVMGDQFARHAGGGLLRFAGGGLLPGGRRAGPSVAAKHKPKAKHHAAGPSLTGAHGLSHAGNEAIRGLRHVVSDSSSEYDAWTGDAQDQQDSYAYLDRKFSIEGPDDSELVDADTGEVNTDAVAKRAAELRRLATIRATVIQDLVNARSVVRRIIRSYNTIIARLKKARAAIRGNKTYKKQRGAYYDGRIKAYTARVGEWRGKLHDLDGNVRDARLDWDETSKEYAAVMGTTATPPKDDGSSADTATVDDASSADTGTTDTGATTDTTAAPSAADIAAAAFAELTNLNAGRADLFSQYGANFMRPGTLIGYGAGGAPDAQAAAGVRYFGGGASGTEGGGVLAGAGGQAGPAVVQHITFNGPQPADPHTFTQAARHEAEAAFA